MVAIKRSASFSSSENFLTKKKTKTIVTPINENETSYYRSINLSEQNPLKVYTFGTGSMCELGYGPLAKNKEIKRPRLNVYLENLKIKSLVAGGMHSLVLTSDNEVYSWGTNDMGVLGRDTVTNANMALKDAGEESDDDDGDLNDLESTPAKVENLPKINGEIIQICATDNASVILYENGDVYAWGTFRNNEGVLGFYKNEIKIQTKPWKLPLTFLKNKQAKIVQIASGKDHILLLDSFGVLYAWGTYQQGQLARKIMDHHALANLHPQPIIFKSRSKVQVKAVFSGENHAFAVTHSNILFAWGLNQFGQCGTDKDLEDGGLIYTPKKVLLPSEVNPAADIKLIAAGEHHSLILLNNGKILSFGRRDMFEIGLASDQVPKENAYLDPSSKKIRSVPVPTFLPTDVVFTSVAAGSHHSLATTDKGYLYTWGFGETYALGLGPAGEDVETPAKVMNTAIKEMKITFVSGGGQFSIAGGYDLTEEEIEIREEEEE
ncbi:hypothetical protein QEN19_000438 [Hanseniaspora menglaensis]